MLLLDSWNYSVEVNADDIEGGRSRPGTDSRTIDAKMSHGNLMQGYNCKYNRLTVLAVRLANKVADPPSGHRQHHMKNELR